PSGTGKTFSSLIHSFFASRFFAPARNIFANMLASMVFLFTTSILLRLIYRANALHQNIDLLDLHSSECLYFVFHIALQILRDGADINAIGHNHVEIQANLVVILYFYIYSMF